MSDPLAGSESIDWNRLETVNGKAREAPAILQSLASGDARKAKASVAWLFREVLHQSVPAPSAETFVPFLVALAAMPKQPARWELVALLGDLACNGEHRAFYFSGFPSSGEQVTRLHQAVARGVDSFLAFVDDRASKVRAAAAFVLAWLPEHADRSVPALRARLAKEKDPTARASMLLALSVLDPGADAKAVGAALATSDTTMRAAGFIASARSGAIEPAVEPLASELVLAPNVDGLCWWNGQIGSLVLASVLHAATRDGDAKLLTSLIATPVAHVVLPYAAARLFPGAIDPSTLTTPQREFLDAVTRDASLYGLAARFWTDRGLPARADAARDALGFAREKTALDADVTVDGVTKRFGDHFVDAMTEPAKRAPFAAACARVLSADDVFAACVQSAALDLGAIDPDGSRSWQRTVVELLDACDDGVVATLRNAEVIQSVQRADGVVITTDSMSLPVLVVAVKRDPALPSDRLERLANGVSVARASDLACHAALLGEALRKLGVDRRARLLRSIGVDEPHRRAYVATFLDTTPHHELAAMYLADIARMRDQYAYGRKQPYLAFAEGFTSAQLKKLAPRDHPLAKSWTAPIAAYVSVLRTAGLDGDAASLQKSLDAFLSM